MRIHLQHGPNPILPGEEDRLAELQRVLQDEARPFEERMEAARILAPYWHPRYETVELSGELNSKHPDWLAVVMMLAPYCDPTTEIIEVGTTQPGEEMLGPK